MHMADLWHSARSRTAHDVGSPAVDSGVTDKRTTDNQNVWLATLRIVIFSCRFYSARLFLSRRICTPLRLRRAFLLSDSGGWGGRLRPSRSREPTCLSRCRHIPAPSRRTHGSWPSFPSPFKFSFALGSIEIRKNRLGNATVCNTVKGGKHGRRIDFQEFQRSLVIRLEVSRGKIKPQAVSESF